MAYLLWLFMALVPFWLGRGALRLLYRALPVREITLADSVLTGYLIMIGLAEGAHLGAVMFGQSFSDTVKWFVVLLAVCLAAAGIILLADARRRREDRSRTWMLREEKSSVNNKQRMLFAVFALLALAQVMLLTLGGQVYLGGDMTVETVNSFLATDAVYQVNPMTGEPYIQGIPMRLKILCLPTFYGILCSLFRLSAEQVVWSIMPAATLLYSYLAYGVLARELFPEKGERRGFFLLLVALLYFCGDYLYGMDGFGVMHGGYRGVAIRAAVLLPCLVGLVLRRRWKLVILCILAETCMVWTLYGLGDCLFVAAGLTLVRALVSRLGKGAGGKEAPVL